MENGEKPQTPQNREMLSSSGPSDFTHGSQCFPLTQRRVFNRQNFSTNFWKTKDRTGMCRQVNWKRAAAQGHGTEPRRSRLANTYPWEKGESYTGWERGLKSWVLTFPAPSHSPKQSSWATWQTKHVNTLVQRNWTNCIEEWDISSEVNFAIQNKSFILGASGSKAELAITYSNTYAKDTDRQTHTHTHL